MKVVKPSIKMPSGRVVQGKPGGAHKDISQQGGQRGFTLSDGSFAGRGKASKVAASAGQAKPVKALHSHMLKGSK